MLDRPPWPEEPGLHFLAYWAVRAEKLCESPYKCPESERQEDGTRTRCPRCPLNGLDDLMQSWQGSLLARAAEIRMMTNAGLTVGPADIDYDEWIALKAYLAAAQKLEAEPKGNHHG